MARATWKGKVLAESDRVEIVEGNVYFPPDAVKREHVRDSGTHSTCPWKGEASYYDVVVDGETNRDAAWYYPAPSAPPPISRITSRSGEASRSNARTA